MIIKAYASICDYGGTELEVTDDEVKDMNEKEKKEYIDNLVAEWAETCVSWGWEEK